MPNVPYPPHGSGGHGSRDQGGPPSWPSHDHPATTVLRPAAGAGVYVRRLLPWSPILIVFFLVMLVLGSILFETFAEGTGLALGILTGLVGVVAMTGVLVMKLRRMVTGTTVLVSPTGVELCDRLGCVVWLRWDAIVEVGTVEDVQGSQRRVRAPGPGGVSVKAPVVRSQGIMGWGERWLPPRAPNWLRQHIASQPRDPATGREMVAVSFAAAGRVDASNPLLAQVRHHRPDLFR